MSWFCEAYHTKDSHSRSYRRQCRNDVKLSGLKETKWFCNEVWKKTCWRMLEIVPVHERWSQCVDQKLSSEISFLYYSPHNTQLFWKVTYKTIRFKLGCIVTTLKQLGWSKCFIHLTLYPPEVVSEWCRTTRSFLGIPIQTLEFVFGLTFFNLQIQITVPLD